MAVIEQIALVYVVIRWGIPVLQFIGECLVVITSDDK